MTAALIKVEGVSKKYCRPLRRSLRYAVYDLAGELLGRPRGGSGTLRPHEFWALSDVDFELHRGECIGLIGHNGAGKTTLLKVIGGLLKPDAGRVELDGRVVALIALGAGFNPILTGRENIYVSAAIFGIGKSEVDATISNIIEFAELEEFIDAPVQSYSSGMVVRLGFSIAVHARPDILILDEVLAVGDIGFQIKCYNALSRMRREGVGFVLVSHNMHQVSRFSTRTLYLRHGRIVHYGDNAAGIEAYLRDSNVVVDKIGEGHDAGAPAGSGAVLLTNPQFLDGAGRPVSSIDAGRPLVFTIDFVRSAPRVEHAALDLIVRDANGTVFQATHPFATTDAPLPDRGRMDIRFDVIPSNVHALYFSCSLIGTSDVEIYDCLFDIRLDVRPDPLSHGSLVLPVSWSLHQDRGAGLPEPQSLKHI